MIIKTNGGLSVLSAFVNGYGAAASIELPMNTEIKAKDEDVFPTLEIASTVNFLRERFALKEKYSINIQSRIPMGMGLKSSSAMTLSLVYGILKMNNIDKSSLEVLKIASEASIYNKTSITGALDDLSIAYFGGFCFTNNSKNQIISKQKLENKYIILELNDGKKWTYEMKSTDFSGYRNYYDSILELLKNGHIYESMMLNGYIFSDGSENNIVKRMLGTGAIYAGMSGKGPAVFGIYETEKSMESSFKELSSDGYRLIKSRFNNYGINIYEQ